MKRRRLLAVMIATALAQGCMASTIVLHVDSDGSGRATVVTRLYLSGMRAFDAMFAAEGTAPSRPPQLEEELPPPSINSLNAAFGVPVRLLSSRLQAAEDGGIRTTEVAFDDVRKLQMLFPPIIGAGMNVYGFGLTGVTERPLMTFSIRPHENGDRMLVVKLPNPSFASRPDDPVTVFDTDSPQERLFKQAIRNMSLRLFIEIDQPVLRTNAPQRDGDRATILDLNLDKMINAMDEPRLRRMMAPGSFQEMLWQLGDLPGAVIPTENEVFLEYEGPQRQATPAPPPTAAPPDTEIYLASLSQQNGRLALGSPANITNNPGYDNQPFFTPDGRGILFSSARAPSGPPDPTRPSQTDIFRYDRATSAVARVTETPESEYSPTVMPDGIRISMVRVEADGAQRLWGIAPGGSRSQLELLLPGVKPVGYHAWASDHTLALFVLGANGAPATLQLADTRTGEAHSVATDIGRSIQRMPGSGPIRHISFVQRERSGDRVTLIVKELDPESGGIRTLVPAVDGSREADLAWMPDGTLLMVKDDVLYAWRQGQPSWTEVQRLSLRGVTRLAVSPTGDALALVAAPASSIAR